MIEYGVNKTHQYVREAPLMYWHSRERIWSYPSININESVGLQDTLTLQPNTLYKHIGTYRIPTFRFEGHLPPVDFDYVLGFKIFKTLEFIESTRSPNIFLKIVPVLTHTDELKYKYTLVN